MLHETYAPVVGQPCLAVYNESTTCGSEPDGGTFTVLDAVATDAGVGPEPDMVGCSVTGRAAPTCWVLGLIAFIIVRRRAKRRS